MRGDHFRCHRDRLGRVADHERAAALVHRDLLDLQDALEHGLKVLHVRVHDLERAHLQILVLLLLGRCGRVDEQRVGVEGALFELVLQQDEIDRVLDRGILDEDGRLQVGTHVPIQDHVQAGRARQGLEHHAQVGIAKLQCHRLVHHRQRGGLCSLGLARLLGLLADRGGELLGRRVRRVVGQRGRHLVACRIDAALAQQDLGIAQQPGVTHVEFEAVQTAAPLLVGRVHLQGAGVKIAGLGRIARPARVVGACDQVGGVTADLAQHVDAVFGVAGLELRGGFEVRQRQLVIAQRGQLHAVLVMLKSGTAR